MGHLLLALGVAVAGCGHAAPVDADAGYAFPALTGRVVDDAGLLPPAGEAALAGRLAAFEAQTRHQLVVVTVSSLGGHSIEEYGLHLGRHWGIGRRGVDDGLILLVAPNERKVRIEVGYGLERAVRDEEAARIIRDDILPAFKAGDFGGGIDAGVTDLIRETSTS